MSGRRAKSIRGGRGEHVYRRRATVSNVAERAEGKKVEGRDAAFGGRPPCVVESCSECAECSEPPVHLGSGASVSRPSTFFPSAPRPAPARRAFSHEALLPAPASPAFSTSPPVTSSGAHADAPRPRVREELQ